MTSVDALTGLPDLFAASIKQAVSNAARRNEAFALLLVKPEQTRLASPLKSVKHSEIYTSQNSLSDVLTHRKGLKIHREKRGSKVASGM